MQHAGAMVHATGASPVLHHWQQRQWQAWHAVKNAQKAVCMSHGNAQDGGGGITGEGGDAGRGASQATFYAGGVQFGDTDAHAITLHTHAASHADRLVYQHTDADLRCSPI